MTCGRGYPQRSSEGRRACPLFATRNPGTSTLTAIQLSLALIVMDITHREIIAYWAARQDENSLSIDWADADKVCWRCAHGRMLQRCHIVPKSLGGSDQAFNLVLLCKQCHAEAPNVADPDFMWIWLRAHAVTHYGTYWQRRGIREYELIFGEKPFQGIDDPEAALEQSRILLEGLFHKTSTHWGQGKPNPSTWAWVYRQVDQALRTKSASIEANHVDAD
jgi:HNH endonuclease